MGYNPIAAPTAYPSQFTHNPTADPTLYPSTDPTIDPTADPSINPTRHPTNDPSFDPTVNPTNDPTTEPTTDPTNDPTYQPTADPTNDPSSDPTAYPSSDPTINPTMNNLTIPINTATLSNDYVDTLDLMVVLSFGALLFVCSLSVLYYVIQRKKRVSNQNQAEIKPNVQIEQIQKTMSNVSVTNPGVLSRVTSVISKMQTTDSLYVHDESDDNDDDADNKTDTGNAMNTPTGNDDGEEGLNEYQRIQEILEAIYGNEHEKYLMKFKKEMISDQKLFENEKFIKMHDREHPLWNKLIPEHGARFDFFEQIYADV